MRSQACGRLIDPAPLTLEELTSANERTHASRAYFKSLLDLRRAGPSYDLTSLLVAVEEVGDSLSDEELTANIMLLFGAGHETTSNLIGNGLLALHNKLAQLALMQKGDINWPDVI